MCSRHEVSVHGHGDVTLVNAMSLCSTLDIS